MIFPFQLAIYIYQYSQELSFVHHFKLAIVYAMDVVKEDMAEVEVTEEDTVETGERKSAVATPDGKSRKKKKKNCLC